MNSVQLSGFLGKDPMKQYGNTNGKDWTIVNFTLAVGDYRGGEDVTDWFDCKMWGDRAEKIAEHFKKGSAIEIVGKLEQEHWESKEGEKRSKHVVNVTSWGFPPAKKGGDKADDNKAEGKSFKTKEERDAHAKQQQEKTKAPF